MIFAGYYLNMAIARYLFIEEFRGNCTCSYVFLPVFPVYPELVEGSSCRLIDLFPTVRR